MVEVIDPGYLKVLCEEGPQLRLQQMPEEKLMNGIDKVVEATIEVEVTGVVHQSILLGQFDCTAAGKQEGHFLLFMWKMCHHKSLPHYTGANILKQTFNLKAHVPLKVVTHYSILDCNRPDASVFRPVGLRCVTTAFTDVCSSPST